jgi:hypothetical protein
MPVSVPDRRQEIYLAESLVLDRLDREFGRVQRRVKLTTKSGRVVLLDGVAQRGEDVFLIEVVVARHDHTLAMRARDVAFQMLSLQPTFVGVERISVLLCVVWREGRPAEGSRGIERAKQAFQDAGLSKVEIREFDLPALRGEAASL